MSGGEKKLVGCDFCSDGVGGTSLLEMEAISPQPRARWMYVKSRAVGQTNARHCLLKPSTAAGSLCVDGPTKPVERTCGCCCGKTLLNLEPL